MVDKIDENLYVVIDSPSGSRVSVYDDEEAAEAHAYGFTNLEVLTYNIDGYGPPVIFPAPTGPGELGWGEHPDPDKPVEGADDHDAAVEKVVEGMTNAD